MKSIQSRLGLGLTTILVIVGIAFAHISLWIFDAGLKRYMEIQLEAEARTVLSTIQRVGEDLQVNADGVTASYKMPFSGSYYVVLFDDKVWRSRSLWDHVIDVPEVLGLKRNLVQGPEQQQLLVYKAQYRRFAKTITVVTATDYTPIIKGFANARWAGL